MLPASYYSRRASHWILLTAELPLTLCPNIQPEDCTRATPKVLEQ